jgi:hypothetical protein
MASWVKGLKMLFVYFFYQSKIKARLAPLTKCFQKLTKTISSKDNDRLFFNMHTKKVQAYIRGG